MKAKAAVIALAALLAVLCLLYIGGPLSSLPHATPSLPSPSQPVANWSLPGKIRPVPLPNISFDPSARDSLVFIHIQKTGGSDFLRHLVTLKRDGRPLCTQPTPTEQQQQHSGRQTKKVRASCLRPTGDESGGGAQSPSLSSGPWLISEKTLGWYCGLHPFYSEYKACIASEKAKEKSRRKFDPTAIFHFSTMLRHPVIRYISEYLHVQRGATFSYRHVCKGRKVKDSEMPPCYPGYYNGNTWDNLTLSAYVSCESNWANNRQTLSVASLEAAECFSHHTLTREERDDRLLQTAKRNLKKFAFFGITEYQSQSSALFEKTFGLEFGAEPEQKPLGMLKSAPMLSALWSNESVYNRVAEVNHLDMQLYAYALELFAGRLLTMGIEIDLDQVSKDVGLLPEDSELLRHKRFRQLNYKLS